MTEMKVAEQTLFYGTPVAILFACTILFLLSTNSFASEPIYRNPNLTFKPLSPAEEVRLTPSKLGQAPHLNAEEQLIIEGGEIIVRKIITKNADLHSYMAIGLVDAPPKSIMQLLRNYSGYVEFMANIQEITVRWDKNLAVVDQTMGIALMTFRYRFNILHYQDSMIEWEYVQGDVIEMSGYYKLFPLGGNAKTLLVYRVNSDPGMPIPNFIVAYYTIVSGQNVLEAIRIAVAGRATKRNGR